MTISDKVTVFVSGFWNNYLKVLDNLCIGVMLFYSQIITNFLEQNFCDFLLYV